MAMSIPPLKGWSSKLLVVAAMIGTLVVVAIAAVIIVGLTPPKVFFYIEDASLHDGLLKQQKFYNFTLFANNTSRRMEVHYTNLNTEIWIAPSEWYSAEVSMSGFKQPPVSINGYKQPPDNVTKVAGWAEYDQLDSTSTASAQGSGAGNWPNCTVLVIAKVLFKVGLARTRPYHIRVSCFPVNFQDTTRYANCT
ncbi:hypothetical protein SEVIR_8G247200v4 [Setaria viridis]|uniref:Late embryogenesis abundant protein LEA-2 subgroup domain-containing protein n=1 Tax=Setaria viridis TaxID=4556 RepID=A0A4U6TL57_SETVI|nr:hypothetical protein SEVIR_8G247200v2 [Setaria viridis]